jgi:hypothetical protein
MAFNPFANRVGRALTLLIDHTRPIRVPLFVIGIGAALTLGVDQVAELFLMTAWSRASGWWYLWVLVASVIAGLALWYTARNAFRLEYPRWPGCSAPEGRALRTWIPRVLGISVPALIALGTVIAWLRVGVVRDGMDQLRFWSSIAGLIAVAVTLAVLVGVRRRAINAARSRAHVAERLPLDPADEPRVAQVRDLGPAPLRVFVLALIANVAATVLIAWFPPLLNGVGPLAIVLLAGTFLCLSGGFATMLANRHGFPLLSVLAAMTVLWQAFALNDNHTVRLVGATPDTPPPVPMTFAAYRDAWIARECVDRDPCTVIVVAAEGGGIRAAAWTAMTLAELDRRAGGRLAPRIIAASGVSGGSLGLATWAALRRVPRQGVDVDTDGGSDGDGRGSNGGEGSDGGSADRDIGARARAFLSEDFLSPTLANLFFVDFTQRLLPMPLFDDRGRALTLSWESAWQRRFGNDAFSLPFGALYRDAQGAPDTTTPALFFNSTAVGSGARVVQHPFASLPMVRGRAWAQAIDGATLLPATLPLSEAVLNSARFTYVSPAGTVTPNGDPLQRVQLVDGGYFENSGATTLSDVVAALRDRRGGPRLVVHALHISNDPNLPGFASSLDQDPDGADRCPPEPQPVPIRGDASAPLHALLNTRGARGAYAREMLDRALEPGDRLWHLRLCRGEYPIPLGWAISDSVFTEMERQLRALPLDRVASQLLSPSPSPSP